MVFQPKEKLFHDIPTKKAIYNSRHYPKDQESFVKFYYEEALPDADTAASNEVPYGVKDRAEHQRYCRDSFARCLRHKIDMWLDKKAPVIAFPKAGYEKILMGLDMEDFDVFHSDYLNSLEGEMKSGIRMLQEYKYKHRGNFKRSQKGILTALWTLALFIALIVFDVPYSLILKPLETLWQMAMPLLSLDPDMKIFFLPTEITYLPLIVVIFAYWAFCAWMMITRMGGMKGGLPDTHFNGLTMVAGIFLSPCYILMRGTIGVSFFQGVREIYETVVDNLANGTFDVVISVLEVIVYKLFVTATLFVFYLGSFISGVVIYLYRNIRLKRKKEEEEEKAVVADIRSQWNFYLEFRRELINADRQLKFMDMWNQSAKGKGHFPGWFDINEYAQLTEYSLLEENRARIGEIEKKEQETTMSQESAREKLMAQIQKLKKQQEEEALKSKVTDGNKRKQAMVSFASLMGEGPGRNPELMFDDLATVLGYEDIRPMWSFDEKGPGAKEYASGLSNEKEGKFYSYVKDDYEKAAWQGSIPALARLANVYDLDYDINSEIAYGEDIGLQQWSHPLEREAKEARLVMGLSPDAPLYALLRQAKKEEDGFDCEALYYLAVHCKKDSSLKGKYRDLVYVFVSMELDRQAKRKDSESPRAAYYLAMLNYHCLGDKDGGRVWAEISAEEEYGAAMYFLYEYQKELGLKRKEGDGYCYEAWRVGYPPARVCKIWDHQKQESQKEKERQLNKARSDAAFERKQEEKKAMMEAYEKKLREREKVFNAFVYDSYMDDDGTYLSGKMSTKEYLDSGLYRDDKMRSYEQKVDRELSEEE